MVLAEIGSDAYNVVLVLHILAVVAGIGTMMLNGVYGAQAKARKGREGLAIAEANLKVASIAEWIVYTIPLFGFGLVFMSDSGGERVYDFDQTWIWLAILLFVVAIGIAHAVMFPTAKKMQALMREMGAAPPPGDTTPPTGPPPQLPMLEALGKRIATGGATLNLITVALIALMVWKPGY